MNEKNNAMWKEWITWKELKPGSLLQLTKGMTEWYYRPTKELNCNTIKLSTKTIMFLAIEEVESQAFMEKHYVSFLVAGKKVYLLLNIEERITGNGSVFKVL